MKLIRICLFSILLACGAVAFAQDAAPAKTPVAKAEILAVMERMADAQLAQPGYQTAPPADWIAGAFYVGLARLIHVTENPKFLAAAMNIADKNGWEFKTTRSARDVAFADNETIGQLYIDLAVTTKDLSKLDKVKAQWNEVIAGFDDPANIGKWGGSLARDGQAMPWWWCDAFFMAPPGLTRLSVVTGDRKYLDAMEKQWQVTYDKLYDKDEHLFYRDSKYLTQKSVNGKKVFWSRGNGWVVAGTANVLTYLPKDDPMRPKFEQLFKEMCEKLATLQQPDGMWRMSLIDPEANPNPETSGTGFFCYAMAWGINNGYLDRAKYEPIIDKAWAAMNAHILPNGLIGAVQPVGEQPVGTTYDQVSQPYAVGAFLLAGSEIIKLHGDVAASAEKPVLAMARATGHSNTSPDRLDDIFWENDRTAHRIYGPGVSQPAPAGEGLVSSGIDVWVKRVRTPFMDKQLMTGKQHNDNGDGRDCYDVGTTRGCGGLGIWDEAAKKLIGSANWESNGGFVNGPDVASFWVTYAPWDAGGGRKVKEKRSFTLPAGTNFTRMVSTIDDVSAPANPADLLVGIGLTKRKADGTRFVGDGVWSADKDKGVFVYWEPEQPNYLGAAAGHTGVAVLVDPKTIVNVIEDDPSQYLVIVRVKPGQPWVYYAGACWSLGLDFKTQPEWKAYAEGAKTNFDPAMPQ